MNDQHFSQAGGSGDKRRQIPVAEPMIGERELAYVTDAVRSGWVSSIGKYVTRFEEGIASASGARYAVATNNGTAALHLALLVLGIGPGDEVIVPSLTFVATANAVRYVGATPVFADSDADHWCIDPVEIERCITPRTKAIVPVHLYGHPADMDPIDTIARSRGIAIVEDAAEALGTTYRGRPVGAIGDAGVFSFYGNKLVTTGEGGMLVTNDAALADRARLLRDHAMDPVRRYWHGEVGYNFRLTNIQAALGLAQVERMGEFLARKREVAQRYRAGLDGIAGLRLQREMAWARSSWWMSTVELDSAFGVGRDLLARALAARGVDTRPVFLPVHTLPPYREQQVLHNAQRIARQALTLPSAASLTAEDQDYVIACVREISAVARYELSPRRQVRVRRGAAAELPAADEAPSGGRSREAA
jgi:perosamine synthetase